MINDKTYSGGDQELIDEFPAFSYTLGDLHPHVLSMPFVMLAMALAMNLYLGGAEQKERLRWFGLTIRADALLLALVVFGGLAFLNIWDFPIYGAVFGLAYMLRNAQHQGWSLDRFYELLALGVVILVGGILLYLPFYLGFTSQAGGILPNMVNPSRGTHLWIMFAILWTPTLVYLLRLWKHEAKWKGIWTSLVYGLVIVVGLWLLSLILASLYALLLPTGELGRALAALGAPDFGALVAEGLRRRLVGSGGWISLTVMLGLAFGLLLWLPRRKAKAPEPTAFQARSFMVLLVFVGAVLVTVPEFIYLRDQFGTRMNTVFKFYFEAWQMWAVVAAVVVVVLLQELRAAGRAVFAVVAVLLLAAGFVYPLFSFSDITHNPVGSLDGASWLPGDVNSAIQWLQQAPAGYLVEAVGGSYDASYARYATYSGQAGLMGWPGHEGQWRGGNVDWSRLDDIQTLYSTADWSTAQSLLNKYDVKYVIVGDLERAAYTLDEAKFMENLPIVYQNNSVTIYQVP